MEHSIPPIVGSQWITRKSGAIGTVKEVIKNQTGSYRVRIELNDGATRWTTVK